MLYHFNSRLKVDGQICMFYFKIQRQQETELFDVNLKSGQKVMTRMPGDVHEQTNLIATVRWRNAFK